MYNECMFWHPKHVINIYDIKAVFKCTITLEAIIIEKQRGSRWNNRMHIKFKPYCKGGDDMGYNISIGNQGFDDIRGNQCFYIDKTAFIKEWWDAKDVVTLITRPRRFGKTLNMSMLNCFFSNRYAGRSDLFEGLSVWEDEKYRQLQGTYPVLL